MQGFDLQRRVEKIQRDILNHQRGGRGEGLSVDTGETERGEAENIDAVLEIEVEGNSDEVEGEGKAELVGTGSHRVTDSGI